MSTFTCEKCGRACRTGEAPHDCDRPPIVDELEAEIQRLKEKLEVYVINAANRIYRDGPDTIPKLRTLLADQDKRIVELEMERDELATDSLPLFQSSVGQWGDDTFPGGTPETIVAHLNKEVLELTESGEPEEAADCLLLLLHHAHRSGYDLLGVAQAKMEVNRTRTWGTPDADGVVEHVKEPS